VLHVDKFVLPSFRRLHGRTSIQACRWLKRKLFSKLKIDGPDSNSRLRVFISRRKAGVRRIVNEKQVVDCLESFGFHTYVLEEMSFSDQVRLFSQADAIVAPHGAGLANMIFSFSGTRVLEFFGGDYISPCFYTLANGLNLNYTNLVCPQEGSDMVVGCDELSERLDHFLRI
jgi:capsular polysaccharide biosynthesis protein